MNGETEVIVELYRTVKFVLTADWAALEPFVTRILHLAIMVFAIMWTWKKIKKL